MRWIALLSLSVAACADSTADQIPPKALAFMAQPGNATAGATSGTAVRVAITDSLGNVVRWSTAPVTVTLDGGPAGAALGGTVTRHAVGGVATFDDLTVDIAANDYRLRATSNELATAVSESFAILPGALAQLGFVSNPPGVMAGAEMETEVRVALQDAFGNTIASLSRTIGLALTGGTTGAVLGGPQSVPTVNGVATFDHLTVDRAGSDYALTATTVGAAGTSDPFTVAPQTLFLERVTPAVVATFPGYPLRDSLRVRLTNETGQPVSGLLVRFTTNLDGSTITDTVRTNDRGEAVAWLAMPTPSALAPDDSLAADVTVRVAGYRTTFRAAVTLGDWNWRRVRPMEDSLLHGILVDPTDESVWYAWGGYMYVTHDAGSTWMQFRWGSNSDAVVIDPNNPRRVLAASGPTLLETTDRGLAWTLMYTFPDYNRSIHISARDSSIWFAPQWPAQPGPGLTPGIYRSTDNGRSFQHLPYGIPAGVQILTWDIEENPVTGTLYLANEIADHPSPYRPPFLRSTDRGATWQDVAQEGWWHATAIQVAPDGSAVYAKHEGSNLWKSTDDGATWTRISTQRGLTLTLDPTHPNRLYVGNLVFTTNYTGGVFLSLNGGERFWLIGLGGKFIGRIALNANGTRVYLASYQSGIWVGDVPDIVR